MARREGKIWIKIKRGLILDPKHREALGVAIWLYFHIIDRAEWETGIVHGWKDQAEAEDMELPLGTLRHQFSILETAGYITRERRQYDSRIIIHKWINPRGYSCEVLNIQPANQTNQSSVVSVGEEGDQSADQIANQTDQSSAVTLLSSQVIKNQEEDAASFSGNEEQGAPDHLPLERVHVEMLPKPTHEQKPRTQMGRGNGFAQGVPVVPQQKKPRFVPVPGDNVLAVEIAKLCRLSVDKVSVGQMETIVEAADIMRDTLVRKHKRKDNPEKHCRVAREFVVWAKRDWPDRKIYPSTFVNNWPAYAIEVLGEAAASAALGL